LSINATVHRKSADLSKRSPIHPRRQGGLLEIGAGLMCIVIYIQDIHLRRCERNRREGEQSQSEAGGIQGYLHYARSDIQRSIPLDD